MKALLPLLIMVFFLWLAMKNIRFDLAYETITQLDIPMWLASIPVYLASHCIRGIRWGTLVGAIHPFPPRLSIPYVFMGLTINSLLPARLGEFFRAQQSSVETQAPFSTMLAVIVLERLIDGLVITLFLSLALTWSGTDSPILKGVQITALSGFSIGVLIIVLLALAPNRIVSTVRWLTRWLSDTLSQRLQGIVSSFVTGIRTVAKPSVFSITFLLSFIQWTLETTFYFMIFRALGFEAGYSWALMAISLVSLGSILPATPGAVGVHQFAVVMALSIFHLDKAHAFAASVVLNVNQVVLTSIFGLLFVHFRKDGIRKTLERLQALAPLRNRAWEPPENGSSS